jgi:hypothetical protein
MISAKGSPLNSNKALHDPNFFSRFCLMNHETLFWWGKNLQHLSQFFIAIPLN